MRYLQIKTDIEYLPDVATLSNILREKKKNLRKILYKKVDGDIIEYKYFFNIKYVFDISKAFKYEYFW